MIRRAREEAILRQYERELEDAEERFATASRDVKTLRPIVESLRERVGEERPAPSTAPAEPRKTTRSRRGGPTLISKLEAIFSDGQRRELDEIERLVRADEGFRDRMPKRNTITNRLQDLMQRGVLRRVARGVYEPMSTNGSVPGTPKADPAELVFSRAGEDVGDTPGGRPGTGQPPGSHIGGGNAEVASRF